MTSEIIKTEYKSLDERGLHRYSYFEIYFKDGSFRTEHNTNWSAMGEEKIVDFMGNSRRVMINIHPIEKLVLVHNELRIEVIPKDGEQVYQEARSATVFLPNSTSHTMLLGRICGIVKNDKIIEEYILDGRLGQVLGSKF